MSKQSRLHEDVEEYFGNDLPPIDVIIRNVCMMLDNDNFDGGTHLMPQKLSVFRTSESARILGVIPTPSYSHQIVFRPIWNELARRGHDVVVITTDPQNDPNLNITEIDIRFAYDIWTGRNIVKAFANYKYNIIAQMKIFQEIITDICHQELLHPEVQTLLRNETEHFDLVMVEFLYPIMFGFAERFKAPYIGVVSLDLPGAFHDMLGNPTHPVAYPDYLTGFVGTLNFWERLGTVLISLLIKCFQFFHSFQTYSTTKSMMEEHFGKDIRLRDVIQNVSLLLVNENPAFYVRPVGPSFVLFGGGTHMSPLKPLPQDLKGYLDDAEDGFIYFSLGTNVKSDVFLPEKRKIVLDAFRELPYKVLWKFDVTDIPDVPDNVKISTWLPQQDILRHPNVKAFITQGGLQSTEEAIFSHVPIVGIPYVADQMGNIKKIVARGAGIYLDKDDLTKESLKKALLEIISNPKYKESITEIAELSKDQPMTGIEKAIWWTEYVIRHKGTRHFRNPVIDLPFYQYYFLDVLAFTVVVTTMFLFLTYKLIVFIKTYLVMKFFTSSTKVKSQ